MTRKAIIGELLKKARDAMGIANLYLYFAREVELLERELKRLGSEKVHIMIGNPPYDGDES